MTDPGGDPLGDEFRLTRQKSLMNQRGG